MKWELLIELGGWLGTAALLLAYGLVSTRRLAGDSKPYQLLNLLGGVLVLVNSFVHGAMPSVAVNVFWIAIALFALGRVAFGRRTVGDSTFQSEE
jgi:hypothetical protein